ncbi:MAG TPA: helix-turn-helix domain-containing protein [Thermoanaerobaculia bacterium]|nr:helix-turn-helix domain-containing protein [Thermoanaerobaculia bacterium]
MRRRDSAADRSLTLKETAFRAMASPHRLELITALGDAGSASIAELALVLGRTPHSLYYHIKLLEEAGIVVPAEKRRRGRRDEQVWALAAEKILLSVSPGGSGFHAERSKAIESMLRLTARELQTAIERSSTTRESEHREIIGMRMKGRVDEATLRQINRLIDRLEALMRKSNREEKDDRLFALTIVLNPVADRTSREDANGR